MTQQIDGTPELKTLGDAWKVMRKHDLEAKYCPNCDSFAIARALLKQDEIISDMYEALKDILRESDAGVYKNNAPIAMAQGKVQSALAKAEGK